MSTDSLAARIATARSLISDCVNDADADLSASDEANLLETLEFLGKLDDALSAGRSERGDDEPAAADEGDGVPLRDADGKGVIFENGDPSNEDAWIAAAPDSIERLEDCC